MDKTTKTKPNQAQGAKPATKKPTTSRHEVKCCLCGCTIPRPAWDKTDSPYYLGTNNPWPFSADDDDAVCCDDCNVLNVIPARIHGVTPAQARKAQRFVEACQKREACKAKCRPHVLVAPNGRQVLTTRTK